MGNKVDLIKEIYDRLNTAKGSGDLTSIKRLTVAPRESVRKGNDYPTLNLWLEAGDEINYQQARCKVDDMSIEISLIVARPDDQVDNHLFDSDAGTGALYLWETVLNVLDKKVSGVVDLTFDDKANDIPNYTYDVEYQETTIEFVLTITMQSKQFTVGSR